MNARKNTESHKATRIRDGSRQPLDLDLIAEEPLLIRIDGKPYSTVMRTPGDEVFHAAGFCLGEGVIDERQDIADIIYNERQDENEIDVRLNPERRKQIPGVLNRRVFISQTSCGICGKQLVEDLYQKLAPIESDFAVDVGRIGRCLDALIEHQECHKVTRSAHAALILDNQLAPLAFAEDVGRHNALDKAIGRCLMTDRLPDTRALVLSSRVSYELVQKAARARLPLIISFSRPTAIAAEMATALNMTLVFPERGEGLVVLGNEDRIRM
jgi:FdhD protein